ncbi:DUF4123 domain-containing protein [Vibrio sp.]|uniref:DUF4123 domain-containing protein n=1 Tax=Vibrio sp. TaxID=678 RepID=UPI003AA9315F
MMAVDLSQWLQEQAELNKTVYAIVDPQSAHQPHVAFCQCDGQEGAPLLTPRELSNPPDGPWLLPVNTAFMQWWQQDEHANSGILIASGSTLDETRMHFSSLFQAIMFGEMVFFPFYKPAYLGDMLPRLAPEDLTLLLSDYSALLHHNNEWQHWQSTTPPTIYQSQAAPWWIIKEHHLDPTPNLALLTTNVESWLWQHQPELMQKRIEHNQPNFKLAFQGHFASLEESATVQTKTLSASILTLYGQETLMQRFTQESIQALKDDELLFGLKHIFNQLQGEA